MEEANSKKRRLELDWDRVLDQNDDEPPTLVVLKTSSEQSKPLPMSADHSPAENCLSWTDHELERTIERHKHLLGSHFSSNLPDKGHKLRTALKIFEEELQRRKLRSPGVDVLGKSSHLINPDGFKRQNASSEAHLQSEFTSLFNKKLDENKDSKAEKAFDKELSVLGRYNRQKFRYNGNSSQQKLPFKCASSLSCNGDKRSLNNVDQNVRASYMNSFRNNGENSYNNFSSKKDSCQVLPSKGSRPRKGQTVVLLDEDEPEHVEAVEQENKIAEHLKGAKIYYPSRDDPEAEEVEYEDIICLGPEGFLRSSVMNFYIRYVQISQTKKATCDYLFFNTYFYQKLKQHLSYKGADKESHFVKLRRWWKGLNIFQKAYIFIPIHEDLHWSLVIICIPDKEDESGPIILHLDSLKLHFSKSIFEEIKGFLKEEWNYMNQEAPNSDLPIADRIWKLLPRRIDERQIEVPQQKNDYDCGLFVLFFIERFIVEAPERLKKKDLAMFGKKWFRPEEASGLRVKIRKLLRDEFEKAYPSGRIPESSSSLPRSGGGSPCSDPTDY